MVPSYPSAPAVWRRTQLYLIAMVVVIEQFRVDNWARIARNISIQAYMIISFPTLLNSPSGVTTACLISILLRGTLTLWKRKKPLSWVSKPYFIPMSPSSISIYTKKEHTLTHKLRKLSICLIYNYLAVIYESQVILAGQQMHANHGFCHQWTIVPLLWHDYMFYPLYWIEIIHY